MRGASRLDAFSVYPVRTWLLCHAVGRQQIHKWFVDNVCEGNDDCKEYYCGKDSIKRLVDVCRSVLGTLQGAVLTIDKKNVEDKEEEDESRDIVFDIKNLPEIYKSIRYYYKIQDADVAKKFSECAENQLPTQSGFFFGETSYGIGYIIDLIKTILMLDEMLANEKGYDYYYEASW